MNEQEKQELLAACTAAQRAYEEAIAERKAAFKEAYAAGLTYREVGEAADVPLMTARGVISRP